MKLISIRLKNFTNTVESFHKLSGNLIVIAGENGAGKSSILKALLWCLYGKSGMSIRQSDLVRRGSSDMFVEVTLQIDDRVVCITRSVSVKGTKTKAANLTLTIDGENCTKETINEIENEIVELCGDPTSVLATSISKQGDISSVLKMAPAARRQLISNALSINEGWDELLEKCKVQLSHYESEESKVVNELEVLDRDGIPDTEALSRELTEVKSELTTRQASVSAYNERKDSLNTHQGRLAGEISSLNSEISSGYDKIRNLQFNRSTIEQSDNRRLADELEAKILESEKNLSTRESALTAAREKANNINLNYQTANRKSHELQGVISSVESEIDVREAEVSNLEVICNELKHLQDVKNIETEYCNLCNSQLNSDTRQNSINKIEARLTDLNAGRYNDPVSALNSARIRLNENKKTLADLRISATSISNDINRSYR